MKKLGVFVGAIIIAIIVFSMCTYVVREDEVAVVKNMGKVVKVVINQDDYDNVKANLEYNNKNIDIITNKGLHFKIPFLQSVNKYTSKYLTYISNPATSNTKDDRIIQIQMYAQYRIVDPFTFSTALGTKAKANARMDQDIYKTIINSTNSLDFQEFFLNEKVTELLESKKKIINVDLLRKFGLYAVDIGINRRNFPAENIKSIEDKMSKKIDKESQKLIAEGDAEYQKRKSKTDREKKQIIAAAVEKAAVVKAKADAEATRIYESALKKDLSFYKFIKRMEAYKSLKDTKIFFDDTNDFLNNIKSYSSSVAQ